MQASEGSLGAPLLNAELVVIQHHPNDRKVVLDAGRQHLWPHQKGAIAGENNGRGTRVGDGCSRRSLRRPSHFCHSWVYVPLARPADGHVWLGVLDDVTDINQYSPVFREDFADFIGESTGMNRRRR